MATAQQKMALSKFKVKGDYLKHGYSYVYLIRCGRFYKIGRAFDLVNRLNSLQCGNPYELDLIYAVHVVDAKELEQGLHKVYQDRNHIREWFILTQEEANYLSRKMAELRGYEV